MKLPLYIEKIIEILEENGIECYVVGGCVRDYLLSRTPDDYDMCAGEIPEKISEILGKYFKIIPTGIQHGTVTAISEGHPVEITSFRMETGYSDFRHPDEVLYTKDIKKDLERRDFTINAMCFNPKTGIIDIYNGKNDIKNKIIKTVGNPDRRFNEDALRIIRALRFASQLDFKIETETEKSIRKNFDLLKNVAWERIFSETNKLLCGFCGVLNEYRDVLTKIYTDYPENTSYLIKKTNTLELKYYFLLKNNTEDELRIVTKQMKMPEKMRKNILFIYANKNFRISEKMEEIEIKLAISRFGYEKAVFLLEKQDIEEKTGGKYKKSAEKIFKDEKNCLSLKKLEINGNDLKEMGVTGKNIGILLNKMLEMVIKGKIENNRKKLLKSIEKIINI